MMILPGQFSTGRGCQCHFSAHDISWTEKVTNEEVLVRAKETRSILKTIWCRKNIWLAHVLRHENFLSDIIEQKMLGTATLDRKRKDFLYDIMEVRVYGQCQIKVETGQQARKHFRKVLETMED